MMLRDGIVAIPDDALGPYPLADRPRQARIVAWAISEGLGDAVAWAEIVGDAATREVVEKGKTRIIVSGPLGTFRAVYGNRPGRRRRTGQRPVSRPHPPADVPSDVRGRRSREIAEQGRLL